MSKTRRTIQDLLFFVAICQLVIVLCATKACQEDYELGAQTEAPDDDETTTTTPTGSVSITATPTETDDGSDPSDTPTLTPTGGASPTNTSSGLSAAMFLHAVVQENKTQKPAAAAPTAAPRALPLSQSNSQVRGGGGSSNWLGNMYADDAGARADSDRDGFTDQVELDFGTDPNDLKSYPMQLRTRLLDRLPEVDRNGDGRINERELEAFGPKSDTGADRDRDGVTNGLEDALGMNPDSTDSDNDGVVDWKELMTGSDPAKPEGGVS